MPNDHHSHALVQRAAQDLLVDMERRPWHVVVLNRRLERLDQSVDVHATAFAHPAGVVGLGGPSHFPVVPTDHNVASAPKSVDGVDGAHATRQTRVVHDAQDVALPALYQRVGGTEHSDVIHVNAHIGVDQQGRLA